MDQVRSSDSESPGPSIISNCLPAFSQGRAPVRVQGISQRHPLEQFFPNWAPAPTELCHIFYSVNWWHLICPNKMDWDRKRKCASHSNRIILFCPTFLLACLILTYRPLTMSSFLPWKEFHTSSTITARLPGFIILTAKQWVARQGCVESN